MVSDYVAAIGQRKHMPGFSSTWINGQPAQIYRANVAFKGIFLPAGENVVEYRFAPGANTGWHRHGHDYVIVPLMDGKVKLDG